MSNMTSNAKRNRPKKVVVRSFADRPAVLNVAGVNGQSVIVFGSDPAFSLHVPCDLVYGYSPSIIKRLSHAFENGNTESLQQAWNEAPDFELETSSNH